MECSPDVSKDGDLEALVFELKSVLNPEGTPGRFQFFTNAKYLQSFKNETIESAQDKSKKISNLAKPTFSINEDVLFRVSGSVPQELSVGVHLTIIKLVKVCPVESTSV